MSDQSPAMAIQPREPATEAVPESAPSARAERGEQKYAQVLAGAREVFLASGFEGASVDDIARTAGISKATLYRHFPDKAALFSAVVTQECKRQADHHPELACLAMPIGELLLGIARDSLEFMLSPFGQSIYRITVAESERFPHIGESFYQSRFLRNRHRVAPALAAAAARGELSAGIDPDYAATVFFAICGADLFHRRLFAVGPEPGAEERETQARRTVETFLRAFGPPAAARD